MTSSEPALQRDDDGQLPPNADAGGGTSVTRWLDETVYYGFTQVTVLGILMLWTALQTPSIAVETKSAMAIAYAATVFAVGSLRTGVVSVGREWPRIDAVTPGSGAGEALPVYVRRAVYLSSTLGLGAYAGAFLDVAAGSAVASVAAAAGLSVAGVALFPHLDSPSTRARLGRGVYYLLGLGLAAVGSSPLDTSVGDPVAGLYLLVLAVLGAYDVYRG